MKVFRQATAYPPDYPFISAPIKPFNMFSHFQPPSAYCPCIILLRVYIMAQEVYIKTLLGGGAWEGGSDGA